LRADSGVHINVQEGERVKAGDPLMDGPRNPHDILDVLGEKELQKYLLNEIQEVYRLQGVNINDKHLEVIVRQMMRWVKVEDIGDTEFLPEEVVDKFKFRAENQRVVEEPVVEPSLDSIPGYDEEARIQYAGGLTETGDESLAE
jgi:DNA-directed RNA polymerase subunit beta'